MVKLTDRPNMTIAVYRGRKTTATTITEINNFGNFLFASLDDAVRANRVYF